MKILIPVVFLLVLATNVLGSEVVIGEGSQPIPDPFCGS